jgi:hypothetical protein
MIPNPRFPAKDGFSESKKQGPDSSMEIRALDFRRGEAAYVMPAPSRNLPAH